MDLPHWDIEDPKLRANFEALAAAIGDPTFRRLYIPTEESRTNVAYGTLTTPDQVKNVKVASGGFIAVSYTALWKESTASAARAAIFIGSNQIRIPVSDQATLLTQEGRGQSGGILNNYYDYLLSCPFGLVGIDSDTGVAKTDSTTLPVVSGAVVEASDNFNFNVGSTPLLIPSVMGLGGPCLIRVPAGTYTVSIQFNATAGSVTVKERKLSVWTIGASSGQPA